MYAIKMYRYCDMGIV